MGVKCKDWPFRPVHITDVTADYKHDPASLQEVLGDLAKLTGPGILSHSHLQGFQSAISSAIGLATTIIEFTPDGEAVRTDSPFLERLMNPACRKLRDGCDCCQPADIKHAELFRKHDAYTSRERLRANVDDAKQREHLGENVEVGEHDGRVYLTYDCPNIGYREYVFPIIFREKLLGVFFAGQIILDTRQDAILAQIRSLPERLKGGPKLPFAEELAKAVEREHIDYIADPKNIIDTRHLGELVSKVCDQLTKLEGQLGDNLKLQRKIYVNAHIREIMKDFRAGLPHDVGDAAATLKALWESANTAFEAVVKAFDLRYVVLFGVNQVAVTSVQTLHVVACAGDCPTQFAGKDSKPTLNLKAVEKILSAQSDKRESVFVYASAVENAECLAALENCDRRQCGDFELVLLPVPLHPQSSIGLLFGYKDDHPRSAPENRHGGDLHSALEAFGSLLASSVSAALGGIAQKITYDVLKILGHESAQLITGIDLMRARHLRNYATIASMSPEKGDHICRNLNSFLQNLGYLFVSVKSLLLDKFPYHPLEFQVEREFLFKWKDFYRTETRRKNLQVRIPEIPSYASAAYPPVWADKALFEQLVYNLLNNAVKYSHRGTKIHLDCSVSSGAWNAPHRLSVVDYGVLMPPGRRVYELYHRENSSIEGLGVGLFLCQRIADAHGGRIDHACQLISRFNVPRMNRFLKDFEEGNCAWGSEELYREVSAERHRIADRMEAILATDFWTGETIYKPDRQSFTREDLEKPTYKVTVWVDLPRRSREPRR